MTFAIIIFSFLTVFRYVHRDLEEKHVGMTDRGRLCVFDLSTSVPIDGGEGAMSSNGYAGVMNALTSLVWLHPSFTNIDYAL